MHVSLTLEASRARIKPLAFLGADIFARFQAACAGAGARYELASKGYFVEFADISRAVEALSRAGFLPRIDPELVSAARAKFDADAAKSAAAVARSDAGPKPYPFQVRGIEWLAPRPRALLTDEMGLGKTIQMLLAAPPGPVLVVAPAKVKRNWVHEAAVWRPDLKGDVLSGRGSFRWPQGKEILVTNYDLLPPSDLEVELHNDGTKHIKTEDPAARLAEVCPPPEGITVIADEAHRLKSSKSLRTKRFKSLVKKAFKLQDYRVWGATGTPLMNRPEELAVLLQTFGLFFASFGTWPRFLRLMSGRKKYWGGFDWGTPSQEAIDALKKVMLRRLRERVLPDLPTKSWQVIEVDIDKATKRAAELAELALVAEGISLEDAVLLGKLGGAFATISTARKALATAKIPVMLDEIETYEEEGQPLVVFSAHRQPIDILRGRPGWLVVTGSESQEQVDHAVRQFQGGFLKGLGVTIRAGGEGLTLTFAHHALFVDLEWGPTVNQQAEDRLCRIGQTRGVIIKQLIAPGTLDEHVRDILSSKSGMIRNTIDRAAID